MNPDCLVSHTLTMLQNGTVGMRKINNSNHGPITTFTCFANVTSSLPRCPMVEHMEAPFMVATTTQCTALMAPWNSEASWGHASTVGRILPASSNFIAILATTRLWQLVWWMYVHPPNCDLRTSDRLGISHALWDYGHLQYTSWRWSAHQIARPWRNPPANQEFRCKSATLPIQIELWWSL